MARFTKKHYIMTAKILALMEDSPAKQQQIDQWVDQYAADNQRFNEQLFRKACLFDGTIKHLENCLTNSL